MDVRLGVSFDGFVPTSEAIKLAQRAVASGARSLWVAEHLGYREAIATCMAFALKAPGVMVVPTAVSPYVCHPMPTAMAIATLDEVAPGCAAIAVGTGNPMFLAESGRTVEKPVRAMREFATALRQLWRGEAVHANGEFVKLAGARLAFKPSSSNSNLYRSHRSRHAAARGQHRRWRGAVRGAVNRVGASFNRIVCRRRT
jgi:5,10-methylenetetrahydromethanopterin reductase